MTFSTLASQLKRGIGSNDKRTLMQRIVPLVKAEIDAVTPMKTGKLQRTTSYTIQANGSGLIENATSYAVFVHDGTAPHTIRAVNAKVLAFVVNGKHMFAKMVRHPGTAANPFFDNGLARAMPQIQTIMADWGGDLVTKVIRT